MLATRNRPMMERNIRYCHGGRRYRDWVDRQELHELLDTEFVVQT